MWAQLFCEDLVCVGRGGGGGGGGIIVDRTVQFFLQVYDFVYYWSDLLFFISVFECYAMPQSYLITAIFLQISLAFAVQLHFSQTWFGSAVAYLRSFTSLVTSAGPENCMPVANAEHVRASGG